MFYDLPSKEFVNQELSPRLLANLGDAVFELFERERQVTVSRNAAKMHRKVQTRVNAVTQASILDQLMEHLNEEENDIVRRARNVKPNTYRKIDQSSYRKSTAFEALLGYLFLTNPQRLKEILFLTVNLKDKL
ncbi:MAG: ribonuclease III domain-containing protein [Candidatus Melainabacteria bacterium]|nr:ribonuclease III domain-containing protein [Candidatus Melainabacteria bacterium]